MALLLVTELGAATPTRRREKSLGLPVFSTFLASPHLAWERRHGGSWCHPDLLTRRPAARGRGHGRCRCWALTGTPVLKEPEDWSAPLILGPVGNQGSSQKLWALSNMDSARASSGLGAAPSPAHRRCAEWEGSACPCRALHLIQRPAPHQCDQHVLPHWRLRFITCDAGSKCWHLGTRVRRHNWCKSQKESPWGGAQHMRMWTAVKARCAPSLTLLHSERWTGTPSMPRGATQELTYIPKIAIPSSR